MRLIDADALVKELSGKYIVPVDEATRGVAAFMGIQMRQAINNAPTIEAEPTKHGTITLTYEEYGELCSYALADEQNHGEWLIDKSGALMCSKCGTLLDEAQKPSRYCPNCGKRMDGGEND